MDCKAFNEMFMEAEQYISSDLVKKKFKISNAYWGRIPDGEPWPLHSGVKIRKDRLTAYGFGNHDMGWTPIEDSLCQTDLCAGPEADRIQHAGWEETYFGLEQYHLLTDWICLQTMLFRRIAGEQLAHLERHLGDATKYYWEEFYRSRYIDWCENKIVALVPESALDSDGACSVLGNKSCHSDIRHNGWVFERRPTGTIDERYLRVNCEVDDLHRISDLSLDMLDIAAIELASEDDKYPYISDGIGLMDVVISDYRQNNRIALAENASMDKVNSYGGYQPDLLKRKIGTSRVWRDTYSFRYDNNAPGFYPDNNFNSTLIAPRDPQDPQTWPRLVRVFPTVPQRVPNGTGFGIKHVKNMAYLYAPFAINVVFTPSVIKSRAMPETRSVGSAKLREEPVNYGGRAKWYNPPWECNMRGEKGFFELSFAAGIEPDRPEYGYAYLTRIDHSTTLYGVCCDIGDAPCVSRMTAYCHEGLAGGEAQLNGTAGANRVNAVNGYGLWV